MHAHGESYDCAFAAARGGKHSTGPSRGHHGERDRGGGLPVSGSDAGWSETATLRAGQVGDALHSLFGGGPTCGPGSGAGQRAWDLPERGANTRGASNCWSISNSRDGVVTL